MQTERILPHPERLKSQNVAHGNVAHGKVS